MNVTKLDELTAAPPGVSHWALRSLRTGAWDAVCERSEGWTEREVPRSQSCKSCELELKEVACGGERFKLSKKRFGIPSPKKVILGLT